MSSLKSYLSKCLGAKVYDVTLRTELPGGRLGGGGGRDDGPPSMTVEVLLEFFGGPQASISQEDFVWAGQSALPLPLTVWFGGR